jgi:hypothetical protein
MALVRALQTAYEPMDYKLPDGEDYGAEGFEIEEPGFRLSSWLRSIDNHGGIDGHDPMCFGTDPTRMAPAEMTAAWIVRPDRVVSWPPKDGVVYNYERWKNRSDTKEEYRGTAVKTEGHRLFADAREVLRYLQSLGRDLIFEVRISRRRGGRRYQVRKEDEHLELEGRFDGVIVLRADGTLHTVDGCLGTWPISC